MKHFRPYKIVNGIQTYINRRGYGRGLIYSWVYIEQGEAMMCLGDPWPAVHPSVKEIEEAVNLFLLTKCEN